MDVVKVFLASSMKDLHMRERIGDFIQGRRKHYETRGTQIELIKYENMSQGIAKDGSQAEIDAKIRGCQFFYAVVGREVREFLVHEFDVAYEYFSKNGTPKIFTYFLALSPDETVSESRQAFMSKIRSLDHYTKEFSSLSDIERDMIMEFDDYEDQRQIQNPIQEKKEEINRLRTGKINEETTKRICDLYQGIIQIVDAHHADTDILIDVLHDYAIFLLEQKSYQQAIDVGAKLKTIYQEKGGPRNDNLDEKALIQRADLYHLLGVCCRGIRDFNSAIEHYEEELSIVLNLARRDPQAYSPRLVKIYSKLDELLYSSQKFKKRDELLRLELRILKEMADKYPDRYEPELIVVCGKIYSLFGGSDKDTRVEFCRDAVLFFQTLEKKNHNYNSDLGKITVMLADALAYSDNEGDKEESKNQYAEAVKAYRSSGNADDETIVNALGKIHFKRIRLMLSSNKMRAEAIEIMLRSLRLPEIKNFFQNEPVRYVSFYILVYLANLFSAMAQVVVAIISRIFNTISNALWHVVIFFLDIIFNE